MLWIFMFVFRLLRASLKPFEGPLGVIVAPLGGTLGSPWGRTRWQNGFKRAQDSFKWSQDGPMWAQNDPRRALVGRVGNVQFFLFLSKMLRHMYPTQ